MMSERCSLPMSQIWHSTTSTVTTPYILPELDTLIHGTARDCHALQTLGGTERRFAVDTGMRYISKKLGMEERP
ncbi:hypothetical protein GGR56DRAFT_635949 [Xylariaceae sp. FL0804]|nr:hypothetical protein GGR56DRAFT_635949 [Xylariaceae sp. FL0804]